MKPIISMPRGSGVQAGVRAEAVSRQASELAGLAEVVAQFIPRDLFELGDGQRERIYTPWVTLIAFLAQVLSRGSACREAVRRVQVWRAAQQRPLPEDSTSAYCQARGRLPLESLQGLHEQLGGWMQSQVQARWGCTTRSVKVLDGSGISLPDTAANRKRWPYAGGQQRGCGFPTAKMVGLFCLSTGWLTRFALDQWKVHDLGLARQLIGWIEPGEIVVADRGFCGWGLIALLQRKGVDVVMRAHGARALSGHRMQWTKPARGSAWPAALWQELPEQLSVRIVRVRLVAPGLRTRQLDVITTLLDERAYPDQAIADLYHRRWLVELHLRQIKTALGLDILRCQSPALVEKEVWLQVIAYNLVRALMLQAALTHKVELERLSFKGTVDTLRHWTPLFAPTLFIYEHVRQELLRIIAADQVPARPHRSEPRVKKRRPKNYQFLTKPRHSMVVSPSRARK